MLEKTDEELMLAFKSGNQKAFNELFRRNERLVITFLYYKTRNRAIAQELCQEIWIKIIRASSTYEVNARFKTFLMTVSRNAWADYCRSRGFRDDANLRFGTGSDNASTTVSESDDGDDDGVTEQCRLAELLHVKRAWERLQECMRILPEEQLVIFLLRQEAEMSVPEIADTLNVPLEATKSRLRYANQKLRACVGEF